jgi:hypothetical protein
MKIGLFFEDLIQSCFQKPPKKAVYIKPKESKVEKKAEDVGEHKAAKASKGEQEPQTSHKQTGRKHKKQPIWSARKEGKLHCIVCQAVFYNPAKLGKHLQEVHVSTNFIA